MAKGCKRKTISFRAHGKTVSFMGRQGSACGPRKKPSTRHLGPYKKVFKAASKSCSKRYKPFTKPFGRCVRDAFRAS